MQIKDPKYLANAFVALSPEAQSHFLEAVENTMLCGAIYNLTEILSITKRGNLLLKQLAFNLPHE